MPAEAVRLVLESPVEPSCLERVHDLVGALWVQAPTVPTVDRDAFETAVIEVAANILVHGDAAARLRLELRVDADRLEAVFDDTGPAVVLAEPDGSSDPLAERGRGIALARAAVDDVDYERAEHTNRWRVGKQRSAAG